MDAFLNDPSRVKIPEDKAVKKFQQALECFGFMAMKVRQNCYMNIKHSINCLTLWVVCVNRLFNLQTDILKTDIDI